MPASEAGAGLCSQGGLRVQAACRLLVLMCEPRDRRPVEARPSLLLRLVGKTCLCRPAWERVGCQAKSRAMCMHVQPVPLPPLLEASLSQPLLTAWLCVHAGAKLAVPAGQPVRRSACSGAAVSCRDRRPCKPGRPSGRLCIWQGQGQGQGQGVPCRQQGQGPGFPCRP